MGKHPSFKSSSSYYQRKNPRVRPVPFEELPDWLTLAEAQRYLASATIPYGSAS